MNYIKNKTKFNKKNIKGITLISLVVTIIVLLILAGVSILMLTGDNGILKKVTEAKESTTEGEEDELVKMSVLNVLAGNAGKLKDSILRDELAMSLGSKNYTITGNEIDGWTVTVDGTSYKISANGTVSRLDDNANPNIRIQMSAAGTKVTTPPNPDETIFHHVEGTTIENGYVIQDTDGNEFVWIPVSQNQKILLNVESNEDISTVILKDPYGDEINLGLESNIGKSIKNKYINPTVNGKYILEVTTNSEVASQSLIIRDMYALDIRNDYSISDEAAQAKGYNTMKELVDDYRARGWTQCKTPEEYVNYYANDRKKYIDTEDYKNSINNNGGFYIGRYEAGVPNIRTSLNASDTVETIINNHGKPLSKANQIPYNYITANQALGLAKNMYSNENFTSSLLTGTAWDTTLCFIHESGCKKPFRDISGDSKTWGNYYDSTFTTSGGKYSSDSGKTFIDMNGEFTKNLGAMLLLTTGQTSINSANNICDLAGNLYEWVLQANKYSNNTSGLCKGGYYLSSASGTPVTSTYGGDQNTFNGWITFRVALYLN